MDFTLVTNPFPATVGPDSLTPLVIGYPLPTLPGPKMCTLVITSDDPSHPTVSLLVTADPAVFCTPSPPSD